MIILNHKNIKKVLKNALLIFIIILSFLNIVSCDKIDALEESVANKIKEERGLTTSESDESNADNVNLSNEIKAKNEDYIILMEKTEEEKVEETSAEHPYPTYNFPSSKVINIGNDKFLTQINTIRKNIDKYEEATITLEGLYGKYISHDNSLTQYMVYRNGPGCCGNDDYDGFLLINIENAYTDPEPLRLNDWIRVTGTPFMYEHKNNLNEEEKYLFLIATSIKKMDLKTRGPEMVND